MDDEKLYQWVEEKLDEGYSEEQVAKILEEHGYSSEKLEKVKKSGKPSMEDNPDISQNPDNSSPEITEKFQSVIKPRYIVSAIVVFGLIFAGSWLVSNPGTVTEPLQNAASTVQSPNNQTADSNQDTNTEQKDLKEVVLSGRAPEPARATASTGETLKFVNRFDQPATFKSDSIEKEVVIEPGSSETIEFSSTTYYTVEIKDVERDLQGSVYVG